MSRHTELFLDAKRLIRAHPQLSDEEVAGQLGIKLADRRSMDTISTARKDVAADQVTGTS